jgi:hypothetical protein
MENKEIEILKATYLDDVFIIPQDEIIYRTNIKGDRCYFKFDEEGKPVIKSSTTTIIGKHIPMSPFLLQWWCDNGYKQSREILKEKSMYGTFLHILWAKLLLKYNIDLPELALMEELYEYCRKEDIRFEYNFKEWHPKIKQDLIGFIQWVQDYKVDPIAIETSIIGEKYSGTIDLVCRMKYKDEVFNAIVDWKTGRQNEFYDEYIIQLESYRQLWNEKYPDYQIERVFNYGCKDYRLPIGKTVTPYRFKEQTDNPVQARWNHYLEMYVNENPEIKFEKKAEIIDTTINIESDVKELIKEVDPLEFLEEIDAGNNTGQ